MIQVLRITDASSVLRVLTPLSANALSSIFQTTDGTRSDPADLYAPCINWLVPT